MKTRVQFNVQTGERTETPLTEEEIAQLEAQALAHEQSITYVEKRQNEYPDLYEYIDGVVKGDQAQIDKYISDCLAVKAKYPKE